MPEKRSILALDLPGIKPGAPPTRTPEVTWIDPTELLVDESYQRGVGEKGMRLIRRIVEHFDWRKFKPPTAVWTDQGLEVVDGQHSAIAAASHPDIKAIPCLVVEGADVKDRASTFLGINRDRLNVTTMQMHAAGLVAGDSGALQVDAVCLAAGIRVLKSSPSNGQYRPRDTVAVRAISELIRKRGPAVAGDVLRTLGQADIAPVTAAGIRAVDFLLHDKEHAETFDPPELTRAIASLGGEAEREAGVFSAEHCVPKWRGLAAVWFKKTKRRRPRAEASSGPEPSEPAPCGRPSTLPKRRIIVRRPSAAAYPFGDPSPERAARLRA